MRVRLESPVHGAVRAHDVSERGIDRPEWASVPLVLEA